MFIFTGIYNNRQIHYHSLQQLKMSEQKKWPGETDVAHPEVFNIPPPQPDTLKPGMFTPEQLKQFFEVVSILACIIMQLMLAMSKPCYSPFTC